MINLLNNFLNKMSCYFYLNFGKHNVEFWFYSSNPVFPDFNNLILYEIGSIFSWTFFSIDQGNFIVISYSSFALMLFLFCLILKLLHNIKKISLNLIKPIFNYCFYGERNA